MSTEMSHLFVKYCGKNKPKVFYRVIVFHILVIVLIAVIDKKCSKPICLNM